MRRLHLGRPAWLPTPPRQPAIALPERAGDRRADGFHNVLSNPQVGLVHLLPGRGDTLRINQERAGEDLAEAERYDAEGLYASS